jgi:hypothetical protein
MLPPRKINSYTARLNDQCVKCSKPIKPGDEIGWLRAADRKGYFHASCAALPTIEALALVRVEDPKTREGFRYVRVKDLDGAKASVTAESLLLFGGAMYLLYNSVTTPTVVPSPTLPFHGSGSICGSFTFGCPQ